MVTSAAQKAKNQQRRQTDAGRLARRMYNMQPQVKASKKLHRQIRKHQTPSPIKTQ